MDSSRPLKNPQTVVSLILPYSPGLSNLSSQDCKLKFCIHLFPSSIFAHEHTRQWPKHMSLENKEIVIGSSITDNKHRFSS